MSIASILLKSAAHCHRSCAWCGENAKVFIVALRRLIHPYRPEFHYMRGPGPKWREKHSDASSQQRRVRSSSED